MTNPTLSELIKSGIKDDAEKLPVSAVPPQIILDIAEVRQYGIRKYPESGKPAGEKSHQSDGLMLTCGIL